MSRWTMHLLFLRAHRILELARAGSLPAYPHLVIGSAECGVSTCQKSRLPSRLCVEYTLPGSSPRQYGKADGAVLERGWLRVDSRKNGPAHLGVLHYYASEEKPSGSIFGSETHSSDFPTRELTKDGKVRHPAYLGLRDYQETCTEVLLPQEPRTSQTGGSRFPRNPFSMPDGGPARLLCNPGARHLRHNAPTADHALDLT